jgi:hypothetical protein
VALIQIATQVFLFDTELGVRLVVLLLITGFPIAVLIAWAFELTPEGLSNRRRHEAGAAAKSCLIYVVAVAVLAPLACSFRALDRGGRSASNANSIAVLPSKT